MSSALRHSSLSVSLKKTHVDAKTDNTSAPPSALLQKSPQGLPISKSALYAECEGKEATVHYGSKNGGASAQTG